MDDARVWTDVRALDRLSELGSDPPGQMSAAAAERHAHQLQALYRGDFAIGVDTPTAGLIRARYRRRFAQAAQAIGAALEHHGHWLSAELLYGRALEVEPGAEGLYRGLMRVAHEKHDVGRAADAYGRCRAVLRSALGTLPSAETQRLAVELNLPTLAVPLPLELEVLP